MADIYDKAWNPVTVDKYGTVQCHNDRLEQPLHWRKPRRHAQDDIDDLESADALVLMTGSGESRTGGCHFESGYAFASGLPVVVFGPPVNVFHHMDGWLTVVPEHQGLWNLALTLKKIVGC